MLRSWWNKRSVSTKRILVLTPPLLLVTGLVEGYLIRTEWLTKPLLKSPVPEDHGESVNSDKRGSSLKERKVGVARLGESLNNLFEKSVGSDNSLIEKVKGKGRELVEDFDSLSKREKAAAIEALKKRKEKLLDEVKMKAGEVKGKVEKIQDKGPRSVLDKIRRIIELNRDADDIEKIVLMEEIGQALDDAQTLSTGKRKKIKLLFIGDSLSACVGVTDPKDGLVLQKTTAKLLQEATGNDVEWYNSAVVGGTVREIREKMDGVKKNFLAKVNCDEQLVVVIVCGLNDYKSFILSLASPSKAWKRGPTAFKAEVIRLLKEIRESTATPHVHSEVFIPAIPIHLMASDPKFLLSVFPLSIMGWTLNMVWDTQKYNVAFEQQAEGRLYFLREQGHGMPLRDSSDEERTNFQLNTYYIEEPPEEALEGVLNKDVVATDGVHLNTNGYRIWANFIAKSIVKQSFPVLAEQITKRDR